MTEHAKEATRLSAAFAQAAKAWESLSAALSGEITLENEALASRKRRSRASISASPNWTPARGGQGPRDSAATATCRVATATSRSLQFDVLACRRAPAICQAPTGRVEMWRGGCRSNISVAASFVWRCLSGSTMTPFPHPAHRTGHADLPHPALGQDFTP